MCSDQIKSFMFSPKVLTFTYQSASLIAISFIRNIAAIQPITIMWM